MKRLTHYQKDGKVAEPYNRSEAYDFTKKLAEYEDLEEAGQLVRLPCRLDQTVYCIIPPCDKCEKFHKISGKDELELCYNCTKKEIITYEFDYDLIGEFGKTVFLTRGETEQALKELTSVKKEQ